LNSVYEHAHLDHNNDGNPSSDVAIEDQVMEVDNCNLVNRSSSAFVTFDCPENYCTMQFQRENRLHTHLILGSHKSHIPTYRLLDKTMIMYKDGLNSDDHKQVPFLPIANSYPSSIESLSNKLPEGWGIFRSRPRITFTINQRSYLEQIYDEGEKSGAKWDTNSVSEARHFTTDIS
jgi:hypothetical protein